MPYFLFGQNNSGGSFHYDPEQGITHYVYVEADNAAEANTRARDIGLYFDGSGDCSCCGDRWSEAYDDYDECEKVPEPEAPFEIDELAVVRRNKWMDEDQYEVFVHPKGDPFYGAHKEVVYTRKLTYDGRCGYGVHVWNGNVSAAFAVNEKGYDEAGVRWVPYPNQRWTWRERELDRVIKPIPDIAVLPNEGGDYAEFWFAKREQADQFVDFCNAYLDTTPRPKLVDWAVRSIQS